MTGFDPEVWARTQPHTFFSRWPVASRTKCDFCGVYHGDHPAPVEPAADVAIHATAAIRGGLPIERWPYQRDPLFPNGDRPVCSSCRVRPVYMAGRCGECWAATD